MRRKTKVKQNVCLHTTRSGAPLQRGTRRAPLLITDCPARQSPGVLRLIHRTVKTAMAMGLRGSITANATLGRGDQEAETAANIGIKGAGGGQELVTGVAPEEAGVAPQEAGEAPLVVRALHPWN